MSASTVVLVSHSAVLVVALSGSATPMDLVPVSAVDICDFPLVGANYFQLTIIA